MRPTRHETPAVGSPYSSPLGDVSIVLQPIVRVSDGAVVAAEALARFPARPHSPAEETFALAYAAQRGPDLEAACLRAALQRRSDLPANVLLTVNVSPEALRHPAVRDALRGSLSGIVIEITEHVAVDLDGLRA
jgi:EAL domain-containing protein (putative c-di-GMP-specific phosphodiesterase class I)